MRVRWERGVENQGENFISILDQRQDELYPVGHGYMLLEQGVWREGLAIAHGFTYGFTNGGRSPN